MSEDIVRSIVEESEGMMVVRGNNLLEIITKAQRDFINQDLEAGFANGLISKDAFARKHGLKPSSVDLLIEASELQFLEVNGYLYSKSYDLIVSSAISDLLRDHIQQLT